MGVTREDLIRSGRWLAVSDEEWEREKATRLCVIKAYASNDEWATKIKKNVGVLLTGSAHGRPFLKASLESHQKLGFWMVLAYDNFINPEYPSIDYNEWLPPKDVMELVDTFLFPHHQTWGGVSYPYIWQLRLASGIMSQFEYVFCNNGDCVLEKPEGFQMLIDEMGDADIMSAGPTLEREIGTASFLIRGKHFPAVAQHMNNHMVPFEEYEKSTQEFGNTEGRLAVAVRDLGLTTKVVKAGQCPHHSECEQFHVPGHGFWWDAVGFRHIHGELNYAYRYKHVPPPSKYLDERFCGSEDIKAAREYEVTKDVKSIESWWAKD